MLIFRTYRLEMKSSKACKSLKDQKMVSLFLCKSLWDFAFFRFFISMCFSNIFASVIFFVLCVFLNFLVLNELSITLITARFQVFEGNNWSCSMFFYLILLFLRRFLICFIFFFYLYPYFFFLKLWFSFFFALNVFIQESWRPKKPSVFFSAKLFVFFLFFILHVNVFL